MKSKKVNSTKPEKYTYRFQRSLDGNYVASTYIYDLSIKGNGAKSKEQALVNLQKAIDKKVNYAFKLVKE